MFVHRTLGIGVFLCLALSSCGYGVLQTARTTPKGDWDITLAQGYLDNEMIEERGRAIQNYPSQLALRVGVRDNLDVGAQFFGGSGGLLDVKYNLMDPDEALALSIQAGIGGLTWAGQDYSHAIHVPLKLLLSYDVPDTFVVPYGAVGYGTYWVYGYQGRVEGVRYAEGRGHGDGVLMLTAGLEFQTGPVGLMIEYNFWTQVLDDPGDFYSFSDNHIIMTGVRF